MKRALHVIGSLLAILIILGAMYVIVLLIHYAIFGNPVKDTQHIINGIKNTSVIIKAPRTHGGVNASVRPTTAVDYHSAFAGYSSPVHKSAPTSVNTQPVAQPSPQIPTTSPPSDKYDGDCQPTATVGRCADKCPAPEFLRGFDKVTGAAVCGYVTGCPYGDSVALGADCYRNCTNENPDFATDPTVCYQGTGYSG